jgi:hypothetical protein
MCDFGFEEWWFSNVSAKLAVAVFRVNYFGERARLADFI